MHKNSLAINYFKDENKLLQWCMQNKDSMAEIMLILTNGKTSKFDASLMLKGLTAKNLQYAVSNNKLKLAELCLIAGISPNGFPDTAILAHGCHAELYANDIKNFGKDNLLNIAIRSGFPEMRKLLLEYGADPSGDVDLGHLGYPLYAAVEKEDFEAVKDLLLHGAKQNIVRMPNSNDAISESPLFRALKIYYKKKLHETDEFNNFIKTIEHLKIHNPSENNVPLLSAGANDSSTQIATQYGLKTLSLDENRNASLALSSPMLPQQCNENFYLNTQEKDFSNVPPIIKIIHLLVSNDPSSVNSSCDFYSNYTDITRYHHPCKDEVSGNEYKCNCLVLSVENDDLDMVKFLISKGAKLRAVPSKDNDPKDRNYETLCLYENVRNWGRQDEILAAIDNENIKMLTYLIEQGAFLRYKCKDGDESLDFSRGLGLAIEKDNVDMVAILLHHGANWNDCVYEEYKKINTFYLRNNAPQVYQAYQEGYFEKRYQLIKKAFDFEKMMDEQEKIQEEQKLLEEKKRLLLENKNQKLIEDVKNLPIETKLNPVGEDYLLIQQLALAGYLYQVAKDETKEVLRAWLPRFKYVLSNEEQRKLATLLKIKRETHQK